VKPADYEVYFNKFLLEAKQEYRKQVINEKKKGIQKATEGNLKAVGDDEEDEQSVDMGNEKLALYAKLLLPFWNLNVSVPPFFQQLLKSNDRKLKYSVMLLLLKHKIIMPDSVLDYFAAMDDYRYLLYNDLEEMDQLKLFPAKYNNQPDLAMSKLIDSKRYSKPDSVVYLDKVSTVLHSTQGYVYFFKYKEKKDDPAWKLATVGLLSKNPKLFEVVGRAAGKDESRDQSETYELTAFTDSKLTADEPVSLQVNKELKKLLYARRKSAKEFYDVSKNDQDEIPGFRARN
jgi:hypothetical protein